MRLAIVIVALGLILAACGGPATQPAGPGATQPAGAATPVTPVDGGNGGGEGTAVAHVEVASGPAAGTHDATGEKLDCNTSSTGGGMTYLDLEKTPGLYSLTFVSVVGGPNPASFTFTALFDRDPENPFADGPAIEVSTLDPNSPKGAGTVQFEDKGSTIKATITGTTADDVGFTATIECGPVDRQ